MPTRLLAVWESAFYEGCGGEKEPVGRGHIDSYSYRAGLGSSLKDTPAPAPCSLFK